MLSHVQWNHLTSFTEEASDVQSCVIVTFSYQLWNVSIPFSANCKFSGFCRFCVLINHAGLFYSDWDTAWAIFGVLRSSAADIAVSQPVEERWSRLCSLSCCELKSSNVPCQLLLVKGYALPEQSARARVRCRTCCFWCLYFGWLVCWSLDFFPQCSFPSRICAFIICTKTRGSARVPRWASGRMVWPDWVGIAGSISTTKNRNEPCTCVVDLQDVRSAKLQHVQACMKSPKPTHLTRKLERTKRFKRPGTELEWATTTGSWYRSMIGARARKQWSEHEWTPHGLNRTSWQGVGDHDRTGPVEKLWTGRHVEPPFKLLFWKLMHLWS